MFDLDILSVHDSYFDVRFLTFLENGKLAISYSDGIVRIWDLFKKDKINSFQAHSEAILTSTLLDWLYMLFRSVLQFDSVRLFPLLVSPFFQMTFKCCN